MTYSTPSDFLFGLSFLYIFICFSIFFHNLGLASYPLPFFPCLNRPSHWARATDGPRGNTTQLAGKRRTPQRKGEKKNLRGSSNSAQMGPRDNASAITLSFPATCVTVRLYGCRLRLHLNTRAFECWNLARKDKGLWSEYTTTSPVTPEM